MRDDLKAGWLEKRSGDSSSLNALPVDSWKWQRRWFVLAMESGFLYYFRSPQEMTSTGVSPKVATIVPNTAHPPPRAARCTRPRHCAVRRVPLQRTERLMQPTCAVEAISGQPSARWMPSTLRLSPPYAALQVTINLRECVVEDFDAASQPSQKRSTQRLDSKSAAVSLLIRISHKVGAGEQLQWPASEASNQSSLAASAAGPADLCAGALPRRASLRPAHPPSPEPRHVGGQEPPPDHRARRRRRREV
jgi:hypothetical protein